MKFSLEEILKISKGDCLCKNTSFEIEHIYFDSRRLIYVHNSLFLAIQASNGNDQSYVQDAFDKGIRVFMIDNQKVFKSIRPEVCEASTVILVENSVYALQAIATWYRHKFQSEVLAITGSNGKTIIKEWLYQMLYKYEHVYRSPKSYNSQIGVAISVLGIKHEHYLSILEAGISQINEMSNLEKMIQADIGIFTNIGMAHDAGFSDREEKIIEKLCLFKNCKSLIYCKDHEMLHEMISKQKKNGFFTKEIQLVSWSRHQDADLRVLKMNKRLTDCSLDLNYQETCFSIELPFIDDSSIENALHCCLFLLHKKFAIELIQKEIKLLTPIEMRLELKEGTNNCTIINDTYNSDLNSLQIAVDYLMQQNQHAEKVLILSDVLQSGKNSHELYQEINELIVLKKIDYLIGIGPEIYQNKEIFSIKSDFYLNTDSFLNQIDEKIFKNQSILIKGARPFEFEKITNALQKKMHQTRLEVNLTNLIHNLNVYRSHLNAETKIMVMVKAFSYGSGSFEIANVLQFRQVDYLAVAYADEGVELRQSGIELPIMVMNPDKQSFDKIISNQLEPEIYSLESLLDLIQACNSTSCSSGISIHIKLDTGMHRLGFSIEDIPALIAMLKENPSIIVSSIFSHLSSAEDSEEIEISNQQIELFKSLSQQLEESLQINCDKHILNSAGVINFPQAQFDMVRLGIGLYGVDSSKSIEAQLHNVTTFKTTISQIRELKKGTTVGYNRSGLLERDSLVATIGVGYADGFPRLLGNGNAFVKVNGKLVPTIGNICMDMSMIDLTGVDAKVGDEVILFDEELTVSHMAEKCQTIPYEILAGISQRVKRIYFNE
ncbi:MAG: bifunctional UDP-N-acetylmuramoyl-tripeptide:D-alanyl-D-alanine ligase/alanine racemase [Bacteroidetes bacterium]|nr:bifunctional UDP-N-acetylmuramoyl-tripeptide:D-alanyl-D-alanine ligase/alanine racemase [Bacteroidota bacterium]